MNAINMLKKENHKQSIPQSNTRHQMILSNSNKTLKEYDRMMLDQNIFY